MSKEKVSMSPRSRAFAKLKRKTRDVANRGLARVTRVSYNSTARNVYHCCVHKTGSQWVRGVLADRRVYKYSGLKPYHYQSHLPGGHDPREIVDRSFVEPFPLGTIVSPIYIDYENFAKVPKPDHNAGFFVMRDPRDIVVSWYFSSRYSHRLMGDLRDVREHLGGLSEVEGLLYSMRYLDDFGLFAALRSWNGKADRDPSVMVVKFEDLIGQRQVETFSALMAHCDIGIPAPTLSDLLRNHSFERLSGRRRGGEDQRAFYRKGVAGDWMTYFDQRLSAEFAAITDDLIPELQYDESG